MYLQGITIIAGTMTYLAGNVYVRQKMHLYFIHTIAAASFTASAFNIKAEAPWLITAQFCFICLAEQFTNKIKNSGISSRI